MTSEDFIQPDKISIQMGDSERRIVDSKNIIEKVHPHGKGLVDGNNFNIGKHFQFSQNGPFLKHLRKKVYKSD